MAKRMRHRATLDIVDGRTRVSVDVTTRGIRLRVGIGRADIQKAVDGVLARVGLREDAR